MFRRLVIAGFAVALAAPAFTVTPASAAVLVTCSLIIPGEQGTTLTPGLSHDRTAQTDVSGGFIVTGCSNDRYPVVTYGTGFGMSPITSFGPRPLGCSVGAGGAGPDYPNNTPILLGATDPSLRIDWGSGSLSSGTAKVKQGAPSTWKLVLVITAGLYAPPAGKKTKMKGEVTFTPTDSYTCANNTDPQSNFELALVGSSSLIVSKK